MCSAPAQVIQVAGSAMSAGRRPSLFLISTLARAFSKASTTGASSTQAQRTKERHAIPQIHKNPPEGIATMRMMAHFFHQLLWTDTSIIVGVFIPFILESRSIQHHSTVRRRSMANTKLCNSFQALAAYAATFINLWQPLLSPAESNCTVRVLSQVSPLRRVTAEPSESTESLGSEPTLWKVSLWLTFYWPFVENVEPSFQIHLDDSVRAFIHHCFGLQQHSYSKAINCKVQGTSALWITWLHCSRYLEKPPGCPVEKANLRDSWTAERREHAERGTMIHRKASGKQCL